MKLEDIELQLGDPVLWQGDLTTVIGLPKDRCVHLILVGLHCGWVVDENMASRQYHIAKGASKKRAWCTHTRLIEPIPTFPYKKKTK